MDIPVGSDSETVEGEDEFDLLFIRYCLLCNIVATSILNHQTEKIVDHKCLVTVSLLLVVKLY